MEKFQGLVSHNLKENTATIKSGMTLADANRALVEVGLETHNLGDVNTQKVIGAISTGTHGTGKNLTNLATMLIGGCLVTANGEIINYSCDKDPELAKAAQISLGTLGIFTSLTLSLVPAQRPHRTEWGTNIDNCLNHLYQLIEENHNFDFYWYPRSDRAKLRIMNPLQHETKIPFAE